MELMMLMAGNEIEINENVEIKWNDNYYSYRCSMKKKGNKITIFFVRFYVLFRFLSTDFVAAMLMWLDT